MRRYVPIVLFLLAGVLGISSVSAAEAPASDPLRSYQWGLDQIRVEPTRGTTLGEGVVVAIVDSGIDFHHPEFEGRLLRGRTFLGCGKAGCGGGGWTSGPRDFKDGSPHGTWVAGTIGASRGNGLGIEGVAPAVEILPVRVFDASTGSVSEDDVAYGIRWAVDHGADVINLSLWSERPVDLRATRYAVKKGVVVVGSSGNRSGSRDLIGCTSPASVRGTICVGATYKGEVPAYYSNQGYQSDHHTVFAPGGIVLLSPACGYGVLSTFPLGSSVAAASEECGYPQDGGYGEMSGTSGSAPHVAGVAALLISMGCDRAQTIEAILSTARQPQTEQRGVWTPAEGFGIVDAAAAVERAKGTCRES